MYATDLSAMQAVLVKACLDGHLSRLRKSKATDILNAIAYVVRSGLPVVDASVGISRMEDSVSSFPVPERTGLVHLLSEHIG